MTTFNFTSKSLHGGQKVDLKKNCIPPYVVKLLMCSVAKPPLFIDFIYSEKVSRNLPLSLTLLGQN